MIQDQPLTKLSQVIRLALKHEITAHAEPKIQVDMECYSGPSIKRHLCLSCLVLHYESGHDLKRASGIDGNIRFGFNIFIVLDYVIQGYINSALDSMKQHTSKDWTKLNLVEYSSKTRVKFRRQLRDLCVKLEREGL